MNSQSTQENAKTVSLLEFWNSVEVETVWFVSTANPTGCELTHNADTWCEDTDSPEDFCDLNEAIEFLGDLDQYSGTIEGKTWSWDGEGDPTDPRQNSILNLKVFAK